MAPVYWSILNDAGFAAGIKVRVNGVTAFWSHVPLLAAPMGFRL